MYRFKYPTMSQRQIGRLFGESSHAVGRWLVGAGLRDQDGKPTGRAFDGGYCETAPSRNDGYFWTWRPDKVVPVLQQQGHCLVFPLRDDLADAPRLNPPFDKRPLSDGGFEIVNGDGTVSVRVNGANNASWLVAALNTAAKYGHFKPADHARQVAPAITS